MSDDVHPAPEPPFDAVPVPPEEEPAPERKRRLPRLGGRPTVWLAALVLVALIVGQSVGFVLLFGGKLDRLSDQAEKVRSGSEHVEVAPTEEKSHRAVAPVRPAPTHARHTLDYGRDAFSKGDLQTARVVSASYLLSIDGRSDGDRDREPEALELLAHVLAREYSAHSIRRGR